MRGTVCSLSVGSSIPFPEAPTNELRLRLFWGIRSETDDLSGKVES